MREVPPGHPQRHPQGHPQVLQVLAAAEAALPGATLASEGEFGAIARWSSRLSTGSAVRLGIGDDAAWLQPLQSPLVTCDALIEGVHFRLDWTSARDLGWKCLAVSLSDLAAMGAIPSAAFLSLAAPESLELAWLDAFFDGLDECARQFRCPLAGGDTTRSPGPLFLSLCAVGQASALPIRRDGAQAGDVLLVTGTLGDSRGGLKLLQQDDFSQHEASKSERFLLSRHFRPAPRLTEIAHVQSQAPQLISSALDLSDGLQGDAAHIARASGVRLHIERAKLPISPALSEVSAAHGWDARDEALAGGEDYELLLCAPAHQAARLCELIESCGTRASVIGHVSEADPEQAPVVVHREDGLESTTAGTWTHF